MAHSEARLFPALLRHWRTRRGLSQLDLALAADVSPRHVSFLETGRAQPSREMVLRLGAALGVRLRDQNDMLRAAGFPDQFSEPRLEDGLPPGVAQAIERMLAQHELTLRFQRNDLKLAFLTTLTVFDAPQNVTLEELCSQVESLSTDRS